MDRIVERILKTKVSFCIAFSVFWALFALRVFTPLLPDQSLASPTCESVQEIMDAVLGRSPKP